ncbi:MAG: DUF1553 domain-containing protein [Verrucomicrobiae bacterium]|nr:DUF1553 domain-containing protein [Verrucomicrobiae bacterium]
MNLLPRQIRLPRVQPCWVAGLTLLSLASLARGADLSSDQVEFFENKIRPILAQECYECHNSRDKAKGGLVLDHRAAWQAGGDSGSVIVPGKPGDSLLLQSIRHEIADLKMPKAGAQLDPNVLADFEKWIAMGAPDPRDAPPTETELAEDTNWEAVRERRKGWWSFQPITHPSPPESASAVNPVDRFIRARLADENLEPALPADPRTLVRRLHFTLIGLPPTIEETRSFLESWEHNSDDAVAQRVDDLLADPRFGEKWARHWMDWVRYADTHGSEGDPTIPFAWRYRDYLIRALNADVPYDQLVLEHFAGDLLENPRINESLKLNESALGLGHLRMVFHGFAPTDALDERVRFTDDQINTVTKAFMGLTVSCARCHDHKFDAISQKDYYALFGIFTSTLPATVAVDAPGVLEKNRETLSAMKPELRRGIGDHWRKALTVDSAFWEKTIAAASDAKSAFQPLQQLAIAGKNADAATKRWTSIRDGLEKAWQESETNRGEANMRYRWDLADDEQWTSWDRYGEGFEIEDHPAPTGEFVVASQADQGYRAIARILPSGAYSHLVSDRHRGVLASAPFELDGEYDLYLNVAGENSSVRYAVQHYPRSGTVYPVDDLGGGNWRWIKHDKIDYWNGDRIHLELATAGDAPILVKDGDRSWFGIREAILVKKGSPSPARPANEFLAPVFSEAGDRVPKNLAEGIAIYEKTLRGLIAAWGQNSGALDDAGALLLDAAVREGLLPNQLGSLPPELRQRFEQYRKLEAEIPEPTRAPGVFERPGRDQPLFTRGDHKHPADPVPRRFLEAIDATPYATTGTGRLEFAHDLLREDNPFTARVIVNRIWHHLFGAGLVTTMDNFGRLGEEPSHPELLDFLAAQFREQQGWSLKSLIRELVLSDTWRQSSAPSPDAVESDPSNRLLSHFNVHRLEAEAIRDELVAVAGRLDEERYGPPFVGNLPRRSLYLKVKRNDLDPFLTTFDFPTPASAVGRRDATNVPAQSLTLLNDGFVIDQAQRWAASLPANTDDDTLITRLFETALTRPPTDAEMAQARAFLYALEDEHRASSEQFADIQSRLEERRNALRSLTEPVRMRLLEERRRAVAAANEGLAPEPANLKPIAQWKFDKHLEDEIGELDGELKGTAKFEDGAVVVDGEGFVATPPIPVDLSEKTLEAVVQLDNLEQRAGGVMTVQDLRGGVFDSIVFAERKPMRWVAGSNSFARTLDFDAPDETEAAKRPVHLAITYASDGTIRCYRDGQPWGNPIRKAPLHTYRAGQAQVLFGLRHGTAVQGNKPLKGRILEARLYDRVLAPDEARAAASGDRVFVSERDITAALTEAQRTEKDAHETAITELESEMDELMRLGSNVPLEQRRWQDLAHAIFNLKEFIYLR